MKYLFPRLISSFECPDVITDSSEAAIIFFGKVKMEKAKTRKTKNKKVFKPVFKRKYSLILFSLEIKQSLVFENILLTIFIFKRLFKLSKKIRKSMPRPILNYTSFEQ
jgi:hypothetical protein